MMANRHDTLVSVLMPAFNAGATISAAITSVLNQSFQDFEFLIFDDGSTDDTEAIINSFPDRRIKAFKNPSNMGLVSTLNSGLNYCQGKYICRIDADDLFLKNKIKMQLKFMEDNQDCIVSGTHFRKIQNGELQKRSLRKYFHVDDKEIRVMMLRNSPLCHPSVMIRRELFFDIGLCYDPEATDCEDYELWYQASKHGKLHIISRPLLFYRVHSNQISTKNALEQSLSANKIREKQIRELHPGITPNELKIHLALMTDLNPRDGISQDDTRKWIEKICTVNRRRQLYDVRIFEKMMKHRGKRFSR